MITDYSALDIYEWSTNQEQKIWSQDVNVEEMISERMLAMRKDA